MADREPVVYTADGDSNPEGEVVEEHRDLDKQDWGHLDPPTGAAEPQREHTYGEPLAKAKKEKPAEEKSAPEREAAVVMPEQVAAEVEAPKPKTRRKRTAAKK